MAQSVTALSRIIGCDVGKQEIVIYDVTRNRLTRLPNQADALEGFAASLDPDCFVVCEATGGHELGLLSALLCAGVAAHRADARKVKAFIRSFGTLGKTDAIDARAHPLRRPLLFRCRSVKRPLRTRVKAAAS